MSGVGVAHKLLKKEKQLIQIFDKATQIKLFTSSPRGQASKTGPCPNPGLYILDLNPSTVSAETASVLKKKDKQWSETDTIKSHILPSKPQRKWLNT